VILVATGARLLLLALPPYFAWEMLQAPAFTGMPADWRASTMACAQATVGDGVIVLALFGAGVLLSAIPWRRRAGTVTEEAQSMAPAQLR
jgi:hypothetical protein